MFRVSGDDQILAHQRGAGLLQKEKGGTMPYRLKRLNELYSHPMYGPTLKKLEGSELDMIHRFIVENHELPHLDFEYKMNRMFLDKEKPKNFAAMCDVLIAVNTPERFRK